MIDIRVECKILRSVSFFKFIGTKQIVTLSFTQDISDIMEFSYDLLPVALSSPRSLKVRRKYSFHLRN